MMTLRQHRIVWSNRIYHTKINIREFFHKIGLYIRNESQAEYNCRMAEKHGVSVIEWITGDSEEDQ